MSPISNNQKNNLNKSLSSMDDTTFETDFFDPLKTVIHPTSIIGKNVILEDGVKIGPFCTIIGNVIIGQGTRLHAYVTIGFPAQDTGTYESIGQIRIGKNCEIREFVTIHASKKNTDPLLSNDTIIGNNCYIMSYAHVSHNCVLEDRVVLTNNAALAGFSYLEHDVRLMANTGIHQYCKIGKYSVIAPFSGTRQDIPPFSLFNGLPAIFSGLNRIGMRRAGYDNKSIDALNTLTKIFYIQKLLLPELIEQAKNIGIFEYPVVQEFIHFVKYSTRGVSRTSVMTKQDETNGKTD